MQGVCMSKRKNAAEQPTQTAAIYARYSSTAQNDASIEQQVEECVKYARENNLTIIATYEDRAISGRTDRRPGFQKMIRAAERREFQVLLAYKSNRISRNMQSALNYEKRLTDAGVRVVYCKEDFGDNAAGRFMLRMMMNMNQFYVENMSEDIRRGLQDRAAKGKVVGGIPYGYRKGADGKYEIDETAAPIVREIFQRYINDESLADIRRDLNRRGILTRQKKPWSKNSFTGILNNERYTGSFVYADTRMEDIVPAIIEKGVYAMAQEKMKAEKIVRKRHRGNRDYLLTGKLFCGYCLAPMVGMSGRGRHGEEHYYYSCQTRRNTHACKKENVRKDDIELEVVKAVQHCVLNESTVLWIADHVMAAAKRFQEESRLPEYEDRLREVKKQLRNVVHAIEMGVAVEELRDRMDELQEEKQTLSGLIEIEKIAVKEYDMVSVIGYLEDIQKGDPNDKDFQYAIIRDFICAVYLFDDHFKLMVDFTGQNKTVSIPFSTTEIASESSSNGFAQSLFNPTKTVLDEPSTHVSSIKFTGRGFVITWYFH